MKDCADAVILVFYGLFGAALGFVIFMFGLGGWRFVFTGHSTAPWNGLVALIMCCGLGGGWGLVSYRFRDREFGSDSSAFYQDRASAALFSKRLMVVATCLAALYFIWQLAKGL